MSTEERVPGVSDVSIAANASAPARKFSSLSKYWRTTAVPCVSSNTSWSFLIGTPGGGPVSSILERSDSTRSAVTSVNRTTRTNTNVSSQSIDRTILPLSGMGLQAPHAGGVVFGYATTNV